ncbi:MAG: HsdM family class I SAM-dependent methyltransferase, partial [Candidatus Heimdallarchaeaceae archaeon]
MKNEKMKRIYKIFRLVQTYVTHNFREQAKDGLVVKDPKNYILKTTFSIFIKLIILVKLYDFQKLELKKKNTILEFYNKKTMELYDLFPNFFEKKYDWIKFNSEQTEHLLKVLAEGLSHLEDVDIFGEIYEKSLEKRERDILGLFYTPEPIVNFILDKTGFKPSKEIIGKKILDPSCGSGSFLVRAVMRLIKSLKDEKIEPLEILKTVSSSIYGLDIDPFAIYLAKANIIFQLLPIYKEVYEQNPTFRFPRLNLFCANSINKGKFENKTSFNIKNRLNAFQDGFDYIIGNPPYIEAKKMDKRTKEICKRNFPEIAKGAF